MELEPIRVDDEPEPEYSRDSNPEYDNMRNEIRHHIDEESFKLVNGLLNTMYYRGSEEKLFRHVVEAIGKHLGKESVSFKRVDKSFKRVIVEASYCRIGGKKWGQ